MAKKRTSTVTTVAITADRAARLYRFVTLLSDGPQSRDRLIKKLKHGVRGFYRDLSALRKSGISVTLNKGKYGLATPKEKAYDLLPFPDPEIILGEAEQLAKGKTKVHSKLKNLIASIKSTSKAKRPSGGKK